MANNGRTSFQRLLPPTEEFFSARAGFQLRVSFPTRKCGPVSLRFLGGSPIKLGGQDERTEHAGKISSTRQTPDLSWELRRIVRQSPGTSSFPTTTARKETIATGKQKTVEAQP